MLSADAPDIIVPNRDASAMASMPTEQAYSETFGNMHFDNMARAAGCPFPSDKDDDFDWLFGPLVMSSRVGAPFWVSPLGVCE
jgi:hypothetical protein